MKGDRGIMETSEYIKLNEGLRLFPYKCSAGKTTIGYGRNLEDIGISKEEADFMFKNDIEDAQAYLYEIFTESIFKHHLSENRQMVLTDMMFNLGKTRFSKFKKMIHAVKDNDFNEAAVQIEDSNYFRQVPNRAKENVSLMKEG